MQPTCERTISICKCCQYDNPGCEPVAQSLSLTIRIYEDVEQSSSWLVCVRAKIGPECSALLARARCGSMAAPSTQNQLRRSSEPDITHELRPNCASRNLALWRDRSFVPISLVYRSSTPWFYLAVCVISVYVCATGQLTEDVKRWCRPHIRYRSTKPQYNSS